MNVRNMIRLLGASLALVALLAFSTVVVSDFDCHSAADDARCPYCHLTHQAPAPLGIVKFVATLESIAFLPLPEDRTPALVPVFSPIAPRAPPTA
jgi:hypothetical protein